MSKPVVNKVRCKKCDDIIESKHTHDMVWCKCGAIAVDGGNEYQRLTFGGDLVAKEKGNAKLDDYIDFSYSEYEKKDTR